MTSEKIKLGATYRDRITGFEGICTGRYQYLTGCTRLTLQSRKVSDDGKALEVTIDAPLAEFVEFSEDMVAFRAAQNSAKFRLDPSAAG